MSTIIMDIPEQDCIITDQGLVLYRSVYTEQNGKETRRGYLKKSNVENVYYLISDKLDKAIAEVNPVTNQYAFYERKESGSNLNNSSLGGGLNIQGIGSSGGTISGGANLDINSTPIKQSNFNNTKTEPKVQSKELKQEVKLVAMEGYEFLPLPTEYTEAIIEQYPGSNMYKYRIETKGSEMEHNPHMDVYNKAGAAANTLSLDDITIPEDLMIVNLNDSMAYTIIGVETSNMSKATLVLGSTLAGFHKSINVYTHTNVNFNKDKFTLLENDVLIENIFKDAMKTTNIIDWLELIEKNTNQLQKELLTPYLVDLFREKITTIENKWDITTVNVDVFAILNHVVGKISQMKDLSAQMKYTQALREIHARLTNVHSVNEYVLIPNNAANMHIVCGGLDERCYLLKINSLPELEGELKLLIEERNRKIYKSNINTPMINKMADLIFDKKDLVEVIPDYFIIFDNNVKVKVIKGLNGYYLHTI